MGVSKRGVIGMPVAFPFGECERVFPFEEYGTTWKLIENNKTC